LAKTAVLDSSGRLVKWCFKKEAIRLLIDGFAEPIRHPEFRNPCLRLFRGMPRKKQALKSTQGEVYEAAAIEKYPIIFLGGLVRTETKPAKIKAFSGAKVGHQP